MAWKRKSLAPIVSWPRAPYNGLPGGSGVGEWFLFAILSVAIATLAVALAASDFGMTARLPY
jgi:hypothetical protein